MSTTRLPSRRHRHRIRRWQFLLQKQWRLPHQVPRRIHLHPTKKYTPSTPLTCSVAVEGKPTIMGETFSTENLSRFVNQRTSPPSAAKNPRLLRALSRRSGNSEDAFSRRTPAPTPGAMSETTRRVRKPRKHYVKERPSCAVDSHRLLPTIAMHGRINLIKNNSRHLPRHPSMPSLAPAALAAQASAMRKHDRNTGSPSRLRPRSVE